MLISECQAFQENDVTLMSDLVNKIDSLYQSLPGAQSSYKDRLTRGQSSPRNGYTTGQRSQKDGLDKRSASIEVESLVREPSRGQRSQRLPFLSEIASVSKHKQTLKYFSESLHRRTKFTEQIFLFALTNPIK